MDGLRVSLPVKKESYGDNYRICGTHCVSK